MQSISVPREREEMIDRYEWPVRDRREGREPTKVWWDREESCVSSWANFTFCVAIPFCLIHFVYGVYTRDFWRIYHTESFIASFFYLLFNSFSSNICFWHFVWFETLFVSQSNSYKLFISYIFISLLYIFLFSFLLRQSVKINTPLSSAYVLYLACPEIFGEGDRLPLRTGFCNVRSC